MYKNKRVKNKLNEPKKPLSDQIIKENVVLENSYSIRKNITDDGDHSSGDESILPSQAPTQRRYLSQRSNLMVTQRDCPKQMFNTYFENVLFKSGIQRNNNGDYSLNCNHMVIVNKIKENLKSHAEYPNNIDKFVNDFINITKDKTSLLQLLSGCLLKHSKTEAISSSIDSLGKVFLIIDFLQERITDALLSLLHSFVVDDDSTNVLILKLLLSHIKFMDQITNGDAKCDKLIEIFQLATTNAKQEIICFIPDILCSKKHNYFIGKLLKTIENESEFFTKNVIDSLTNMSIDIELQMEIRLQIMQFITNEGYISLFPSFIQFLLKANFDSQDIIFESINSLRSCLKWKHDDDNEIKISQIQVFKNISRILTTSKKLFDTWLRCIQKTVIKEEQEEIDFIILLIMITINDEKVNYILKLIKQKNQLRLYTTDYMKSVFNTFSLSIGNYLSPLLEIASNCLRDKNTNILSFGKTIYKLSFGIEEIDKNVMLHQLISLICEQSINCNDKEQTTSSTSVNALLLLVQINVTHSEVIQTHGLQLTRILDRANHFSISQFRLVMNLLCSIAYSPKQSTARVYLQEHIDILIKKNIASSILSIKTQGVIGIVRIIDQIIWKNTNEENGIELDTDETFNSICDLPDDSGKTAATLISLMLTSTSNCPNILSFCYDELADMLLSKLKINKTLPSFNNSFLIWFCDMVTNDFQSNFIVEEIPENKEMKLQMKYCINAPDENIDTEDGIILIAINISNLILLNNPSINVLSPMFNLLRILHYYRYGGNLETINALLGCDVIIPKVFNEINTEMQVFEDLNDNNKKKILDIYFNIINWFRESINAFISQNDMSIKKKVLQRLTLAIELEDTLSNLLKFAPDGYTISSYRSKKEFKPKTGVKRKSPGDNKAKKILPSSIPASSHNVTSASIIVHQPNKKIKDMQEYYNNCYLKDTYRQLDLNIILCLQEKLLLITSLTEEHIGSCLALNEFQFIMNAILIKLELLTSNSLDKQCLYIISPLALITDFIDIIPKVMEFLTMFSDYFNNLQKNTEDKNVYTEESTAIKISFNLCLQIIKHILHYRELEENNLLKDVLLKITKLDKSTSVETLILSTMEIFIKLSYFAYDITTALLFFNIIDCLTLISNNKETNKLLIKLCTNYLSTTWCKFSGAKEAGTDLNTLLTELSKGYFKKMNINKLNNLIDLLIDELSQMNNKNSIVHSFPAFNKSNFFLLYRTICNQFIQAITLETSSSQTSNITIWEHCCIVLNKLMEIAKSTNSPRNYSCFLRISNTFLKSFLKDGLTQVEKCLRVNTVRVNSLLKSLQQVTRFLHNLCCHSKKIKITLIVNQTPILRETIELLVFRVKAVLAANNCSSVFWMGNLKNKDLHGDEILSQISKISSDGKEEEEDENVDEVVEDDQLSDSENENNKSGNTSTSNYF